MKKKNFYQGQLEKGNQDRQRKQKNVEGELKLCQQENDTKEKVEGFCSRVRVLSRCVGRCADHHNE